MADSTRLKALTDRMETQEKKSETLEGILKTVADNQSKLVEMMNDAKTKQEKQGDTLQGIINTAADNQIKLVEMINDTQEKQHQHFETANKCLTEILNRLSLQPTNLLKENTINITETTPPSGYGPLKKSVDDTLLKNSPSPTNRSWVAEFPKFSGVDPNGWVYRAEQYFFANRIESSKWVFLASINFEEEALQYYRWLHKARGTLTWNDLTDGILRRFGPSSYEDPASSLVKLTQVGTVSEYQCEFEKLSNRVNGLSEEFLVSCFISGLREEIQPGVRMFKPKDLVTVAGLARLQEEQLWSTGQISHSSGSSTTPSQQSGLYPNKPSTSQSQPSHHSYNKIRDSPSLLGTPPRPLPPVQRISATDMKERRAKGLCYHCDERYFNGHTCKNPRLFMIEGTWPDIEQEQSRLEELSTGDTGKESTLAISYAHPLGFPYAQ